MKSLRRKKAELRARVLSERSQMSESEWRSKSEKITQSLLNADFLKKAQTVHVYVSMNKRREVRTDLLIQKLLEIGKRVIVPVTEFQKGTLIHCEISSTDDLKENKWGVREPEICTPTNPEEIELIIVPMAAGDRKGNRLGYGKGFYDRFLEQTTALKVGAVFYRFIFDHIPSEEFDVPLDILVSEEELIFV